MAAHLYLLAILRQSLAQPLAWLIAAALVTGWWLLEVSMPLGLLTRTIHRSTAHYELALLGGLFGQLLALGPCIKMRWTHGPLGPERAWLYDFLALVGAGILMGSVVLVPAELFQRWQFDDFNTRTSLAALTLGWMHTAAIGTALALRGEALCPKWGQAAGLERATPTNPWWGPASFAFAVVLIPALFPGTSPWGSAAIHALDPARMLRAAFDGALTAADQQPFLWIAALLPLLGWSALGLWLATRNQGSPAKVPQTPHALRDPR